MTTFVVRNPFGTFQKGQVISDLMMVASIMQTEFASFIEAAADGQAYPTLPAATQDYYLISQGLEPGSSTSPGGGSGNTADLSDPNNAYLAGGNIV